MKMTPRSPPIGGVKVQVVGRARSSAVDIGAILSTLGGGGHRPAGSAVLKNTDGPAVRARLVAALRADPPRPRVVSALMSSPVNTLSRDVRLGRVAESLAGWKHTGVPITDGGRIVGMISRRDVEAAERDGRLHLPVSSCMSHAVRTAEVDTPLEQALATMVDADIGRLPVLRRDRLVGIVSRGDLLRALYPDDPR